MADLQKRQTAIEELQDTTHARLDEQVQTLCEAVAQQNDEFIRQAENTDRRIAETDSKLDGMILVANETFAQLAEESTRQNADRQRLVEGLRRALAAE